MAINVSQSFHRTSANAVDDTLTLTKAEMLAVNDNLMPSKYLSVCQDDGYIYLYDKSATPNSTTGKFTKFEGGGGTSDYSGLTNKPSIEGVTLSGDKSADNLGLQKKTLATGIQVGDTTYTDVEQILNALNTTGNVQILTEVSSSTDWGYYEAEANKSIMYWYDDAGGYIRNLPYDGSGAKKYLIIITANSTKTATKAICYGQYTEDSTTKMGMYMKTGSGRSDGTGWSYTDWIQLSADETKLFSTSDTAETTLADGDYFPFYDTSASRKRKTLWSNVKSVLKTYFDTLYSTVTSRGTPTSAGTTLSLVNTGDMYNWNTDTVIYCTCSTSASTTAKVATVSRGTFTLTAGAKVCVKFTYSNTASAPTLNVASKGAKNIKYIGTDGTVETPKVWWGAGDVVTFIYDGTQFLMQPTYAMPSMPVLGTIDRSMIFDTTEKVVGKWTDGRPLYQKTINFGALPNTTSKSVAHNISNISYIVDAFMVCGSSSTYFVLNDENTDGTKKRRLTVTTTNIVVESSTNDSSITGYTTLRYTKTTDAANSYNYASENDYSTTEKIIGTWIDGKKIYQKTILCTTPQCVTDGIVVATYTSIGANIDKVIKQNITETLSGMNIGTSCYIEMVHASSGNNKGLYVLIRDNNATSNKNTIHVGNANTTYNNMQIYATIQYTKV